MRRLEVGGPIVGLFEARGVRGGDRHAVARRRAAGVQRRRVGGDVGDGDEYGEERILAVVDNGTPARRPTDMLKAIFADVRVFTKGAPQSDDITALVLRYGPSA